MTQKYEELVAELKDIVRRIEEGDLSLEESIALYERGIDLIGECEKILETAEMRISRLNQERQR